MYYDASIESWRMDEMIPSVPYVEGSIDIQVYSLPKVGATMHNNKTLPVHCLHAVTVPSLANVLLNNVQHVARLRRIVFVHIRTIDGHLLSCTSLCSEDVALIVWINIFNTSLMRC